MIYYFVYHELTHACSFFFCRFIHLFKADATLFDQSSLKLALVFRYRVPDSFSFPLKLTYALLLFRMSGSSIDQKDCSPNKTKENKLEIRQTSFSIGKKGLSTSEKNYDEDRDKNCIEGDDKQDKEQDKNCSNEEDGNNENKTVENVVLGKITTFSLHFMCIHIVYNSIQPNLNVPL